MSIGNKEVYPLTSNDNLNYNMGLTYREWLIGMLASNPMVQQITSGDTPFSDRVYDIKKTADVIINQADAIIKQLDKEVK